MPNVSIRKASELPLPLKSAAEQLLGREIAADEEITIAASPAQQIPASELRAATARRLKSFLGRRAEKVKDIPEEEIDAAIDEATDYVRHSRA